MALSSAQPDTVTILETVAPGAGESITTVGGTTVPATLTVIVAEPLSGVPSLSVAITVIVCDPGVNVDVFSAKLYPTLGQPGRPGNAEQTSGRLTPYVAVPAIVPSTLTCTELIAVPTAVALSSAQPDTVTILETVAPGAGMKSITTVGGTTVPATLTVIVAEPLSGVPSLSVAITVIVCVPGVIVDAFSAKLYPTLGQPGRPGNAEQTSGRLTPYVAVPAIVPSTLTCTELIAVPNAEMLSIAHPAKVTVPEMFEPGAGESITTLGGGPDTFTVIVAEPTSGVPSLSVAITVIVCVPGVIVAVFSAKLYPTLGQPGRPGYAAQTSGRLAPYVAVPTVVPSTCTFTELIGVPTAEVLSIAHPARVTVPEMVEPAAGVSITTLGEAPTWIVSLQLPESGLVSLSVAVAVSMCEPGLSVAVFREYVKPTLGQTVRPGKAAHTSGRLVP